MKKCPYCAEEIQDEAIICRYCKSKLNSSTPEFWQYSSLVIHFRNFEESGWIKAEGTTPDQAARHFWNEHHQNAAKFDQNMVDNGWEISGPRDQSCVQIQIVRNSKGYNPVGSVVAAVFSGGASLINQAVGYEKWWMSSITLRYRAPSKRKKEEEIKNLWSNPKNDNHWERMEQDPTTQKWFIWRRPSDYDNDNPEDDRWDKIPV